MAELTLEWLAPLVFGTSVHSCVSPNIWIGLPPLNHEDIAADTQTLASITGIHTFQGLCGSDLNTSCKWGYIMLKLFRVLYCLLKVICNGKLKYQSLENWTSQQTSLTPSGITNKSKAHWKAHCGIIPVAVQADSVPLLSLSSKGSSSDQAKLGFLGMEVERNGNESECVSLWWQEQAIAQCPTTSVSLGDATQSSRDGQGSRRTETTFCACKQ